MGIGACLAIWICLGAIQERHALHLYVIPLEQRLNILAAIFTLAVMGIGNYYRLFIYDLYRRVLVASCIYSAVQLVDTELGRYLRNPPNTFYDFTQRFAFELMILMWTWALWKWSGASPQSHQLISQDEYEDLSPRVHDRLKKLNDRLSDLNS